MGTNTNNNSSHQPRSSRAPFLGDPTPYIKAGLNPPPKVVSGTGDGFILKDATKKVLRIIDEQNAVESFTWYNLPQGLSGDLIERILYYRGEGAFFYIRRLNRFFFLPFALDGQVDVYGDWLGITPLPFAGGTVDNAGKPRPWIDGFHLDVVKEVVLPEDLTASMLEHSAVILRDYSRQQSNTVLPRQALNDPLLDLESDIVPFARTALLNATGVQGWRVGGEGETDNVNAANEAMEAAALTGKPFLPIAGSLEFQQMTTGKLGTVEEFTMALQSFDNLRLSTHGLQNGGLFQKKAHELQAEADGVGSSASMVLNNRMRQRQEFCTLVNAIWGLGIWCDISEVSTATDKNGDGIAQDGNTYNEQAAATQGGNNNDDEQ